MQTMNLTFATSYRAGVFIDRDTEIMRIQIFCSFIPETQVYVRLRPIPLFTILDAVPSTVTKK